MANTKWGWKTAYKIKMEKAWPEKPVPLSPISVNSIKQLIKNEDSQKLRLINVWATWCGPCIIEYPEFIALQRMYGARDFEFVSISADKPSQQEKTLNFLESKNSVVANYIFDQDDKYALIEAVDPDWNGALPYTQCRQVKDFPFPRPSPSEGNHARGISWRVGFPLGKKRARVGLELV